MTVASDQELLDAYRAAEKQIVAGAAAEVVIGERTFRALDLEKIRAGISFYQRKINAAGAPASCGRIAGGAALADFR